MSALGELYDDLEAHLDAATDDQAAAATSGMFKITDLGKATWGVRKIAKARRRFDEAQLLADVERQRIDEFLAGERDRLERDTAFLTSLLEGYHRNVLDDDPKAKTINTPAGKLVARKQPDRVEIVDEAEYFEWARRDHQDLLRVTVAADKAALKKAAVAGPDGRAMLADEVVPGVEWVPGAVTFSVDTKASA